MSQTKEARRPDLTRFEPFLNGRIGDLRGMEASFFQQLADTLEIAGEGSFEIYRNYERKWKFRVTTLGVNRLIKKNCLSVALETFYPFPDKYGCKAIVKEDLELLSSQIEATAHTDLKGLHGYKLARAIAGCESRAKRKAALAVLGLSILDSAYDDRTQKAEAQARRECLRIFDHSKFTYGECWKELERATGVSFVRTGDRQTLYDMLELMPAPQIAAALTALEKMAENSWGGQVAGRIAARFETLKMEHNRI